MANQPSDQFTLGVEEEYQLVDVQTGELRSRANAVLAADWTGDMHRELQQNTVEVATRACSTIPELRTELERLRLEAAIAAESRGLRVVAAGTHPFSHWAGQQYSPGTRYSQIRAKYRQLADSQNIFAMHVHVGIPAGQDRVAIMNAVRHYSAHLIALSASSPFFVGEETGYASYRTILWRRWPRTGPPPRFRDEEEYHQLRGLLLDTGCIMEPGQLYWELRPHHEHPTLEFRSPDVTPRLEDAMVVAALTRALVMGAMEGVLSDSELPDSMVLPVLVENGWRASRYGLEAELIDMSLPTPRAVPVREAVLRLVDRLAPLVSRAGDTHVLETLPALLERREAADRMRKRYEQHGQDLPELVRWLADETVLNLGLDRRMEQRDA